ncbi:MAG: hypothetical protein ABJK83_00230, partial [Parasphingorhabdus sp.]
MTEIPTRNIDQVFHVGSLDVQSRTTRASLEGPCLSISLHPDEWGQIARIGGPVWELTSPGAVWFDAVNVGDDLAAEMESWAIQEGLAEEATLWRSWFFDGESDDWSYMICDSREKAEYEADEEIDEDIGAPTDDGTAVDSLPGLRLTDAGMAHLERWSEPMDGEAGL